MIAPEEKALKPQTFVRKFLKWLVTPTTSNAISQKVLHFIFLFLDAATAGKPAYYKG